MDDQHKSSKEGKERRQIQTDAGKRQVVFAA
jgi:hypothetical protein